MIPAREVNLGLTAVSGGQTWNLNSTDCRLMSFEGTGIMAGRRISRKAPGQRGTTDLGYSQDARFISLVWQLLGHDLPAYYNRLRANMLAALQLREFDNIQLIFDVPGVGLRAADVNLDGDLDFLASDRRYTLQHVAALLRADDPRFYHPEQQTVTLTPLSSGVDGWEIDWEIPWRIAGSTISGSVTINYAGGDNLAAPEYPLLRVIGPATGPAVVNATTNERIELAGLVVPADRYVDIDLAGGPYRDSSPRIRTNTGAAVEQYLTSASDINTWHLAPANELLFDGSRATGSNQILFQGSGGNSETQLQVIYFNRYIGF